MKRRHHSITVRGIVGLAIGVAGAVYLAVNQTGALAQTESPSASPPPAVPAPTERIDVEQAVAFPYDI